MKFWQITLIVVDHEANDKELRLSKENIETGYRLNPQPLFLRLHDVEAIEIGDKPRRINPLPSDLGDKSGD